MRLSYKTIFTTLVLAGAIGAGVYMARRDNTAGRPNDTAAGKALAAQYCQSCHLLPEPSLLGKAQWKQGVLPVMGLYLGITPHSAEAYRQAKDLDMSVMPAGAVIDSAQWKQIQEYYIAEAPEQLPSPAVAAPIQGLPFFTVQLPAAPSLYGNTAFASYVRIDTTAMPHRVLVGDGVTAKLLVFNKRLQLRQSYAMRGPVTDVCFEPQQSLACSIGASLAANDLKQGSVTPVNLSGNDKQVAVPPLFDSLKRPVHITAADLNGDARTDYIISQFGNLSGALTWKENKGNNIYSTHTLRALPGALQNTVFDYNKDGLPDVWALFAQGEEGIFLFTNKGNGRFDQQELLRFPPSYGSSSFELVDFNGDGCMDILYTCGDNGDYTQVLKPYHGIYIFLNDGRTHFSRRYFYPLNGCYKALARDFDGDGDLDMAAIGFYPAAATPWEAFVYLENKGDYRFTAYTLPAGTPFQKGLTMDAGDLDGDGKPDLVLGNGFFSPGGTKQPLFIYLQHK